MYGLDPTKAETTPGVSDSLTVKNLIATRNTTETPEANIPAVENLTKTEQFSRELFATVAAASQNGTIDEATISALSASLADKIQNSLPRKVFLISDLKIINDNSIQAFTAYNNALNAVFTKNKVNNKVVDILQEFIIDENTVDPGALAQLDPIIEQVNKILPAILKINVPQSISTQHLDFLNAIERAKENLSDMKLYDTDPIMTMGAFSQYEKNSDLLDFATKNLMDVISKKLNN